MSAVATRDIEPGEEITISCMIHRHAPFFDSCSLAKRRDRHSPRDARSPKSQNHHQLGFQLHLRPVLGAARGSGGVRQTTRTPRRSPLCHAR